MMIPDEESAAVINIPFRYMRSNHDIPQCTSSNSTDPSPRNASASCISAITFDESEQSINILQNTGNGGLSLASGPIARCSPTYSEIKEECQYHSKAHEIMVNKGNKHEDVVSPFLTSKDKARPPPHACSEELESNFDSLTSQHDCRTPNIIKGSLYSRIMNANGFQDTDYNRGVKQNISIIDDDGITRKKEHIEEHVDNQQAEEVYIDGDEDGNGDEEDDVEDDDDDNYAGDGFEEYCDSTDTIEKNEVKDEDSADKVQLDGVNMDPCVRKATTIADEMSDCVGGNNIADQWRQVQNTQTGKIYYYNRRTRESRWSLPDNAILLRRKRQVGYDVDGSIGDDERTVVVSLTSPEISSLTDNRSLGTEEIKTSAVSCDSFRVLPSISDTGCNSSIEAVEDILAKTSHTPIRCKLSDENRDLFELDEENSHTILKRCKKLQKSISVAQKRRFFFPDDSNCIEDKMKQEMCGSPHDEKLDPLNRKSRGNDGRGASLHCMFCGVEVCTTINNDRDEIAAALKQHLQFKCFSFSKFAVENSYEYDKVQSALKEVWRTSSCLQACRERFKENIPPTGRNLNIANPLSSKQVSKIVETERGNIVDPDSGIFTLSDDEDTLMTYQPRNQSFGSKIQRNSDHDWSPVRTEVHSSCPFCARKFQSGSKLSMHLLKCRERQKSSKKRGESSSMLHSHLLTTGGRCFSGYPRVPNL